MKRHIESARRRVYRPGPAWALAVTLSIGGACASTSASVEQTGEDVTLLVDELVEFARQRVELSQMRVLVKEIHELRSAPATVREAAAPVRHGDPISEVLEHELVIALASRVNVVESEFTAPAVTKASAVTLSDVASTYGATHLLAGDYMRSDDQLVVTVRLIDVDTRVIVAAARGKVNCVELETPVQHYYDSWAAAPASGVPLRFSGSARHDGQPVQIDAVPVASAAGVPASATGVDAALRAPAPSAQPSAAAPPAPPSQRYPEDFETWQRRRQTEQGPRPSAKPQTVPPPPSQDSSRATLPAQPGVAPAAEDFPWRTDWLARLLKIPPRERPR